MIFRLAIFATISVTALLGPTNCPAQQELSYDSRDWAGMRHDLYYLAGWQLVVTGIIYSAPFSVSQWNQEEKDSLGGAQWRKNVTNPVWDHDHWAMNYVIHPYWGAGYYIRGRERGFSRKESFWISVLFSTTYEFGIESYLERPSIQDIIVTPVAGSALGLYFEKVRDRIRSQPGPPSFSDKVKLGLTDPLGALNRGVNRLLRIDETKTSQLLIGFRPVRSMPQHSRLGSGQDPTLLRDDIDGFEITFSYSW